MGAMGTMGGSGGGYGADMGVTLCSPPHFPPRPPWALARAALRAGGGPNVAALQAVDSAAFVVAMDPPAGGGRGDPPSAAADGDGGGDPPHHWDAEAKALLHGRGYDR